MSEIEEKVVECEIKIDRIFYPKYAKEIKSGEYGIFVASIIRFISGSENFYSNSIKLKGLCCGIQFGCTYKVKCKLSEHNEQYGDTYEIIFINKKIDISSKDKQVEFLSSIINENYVARLFEKYDDVIKLLENKDTEALTSVKGIGSTTALRLIEEYEDSKDYSAIYTELSALGLTSTFIKKLTEFYKSPDTVVDVIKKNPYDIVKVSGVGFKTADEIALKMGYTTNDYRRIKAFLLHTLSEQGELGKSYLYYEELMKTLYDTLGFVSEEVINKVAQSMMENDDVVILDNGNVIALRRYYKLESNIAKELFRLKQGLSDEEREIALNKSNYDENECDTIEYDEFCDFDEFNFHKEYIPKKVDYSEWKEVIKNLEKEQGFEFTEEQLSAIESSIDNNVIAITGGAGCGKTSTSSGICRINDNTIILATTLSGKASVRITEATGLPASTIHRALGWSFDGFRYNKQNKLPVDIVLIDEATMINGSLFLSLLQAIPTGAKVIIMGDVQQLTPIGNCQIFADILESNMLCTIKLTKPHRQALKSGIIPSSIKVANQEQIFKTTFEGNEILGELQDMELDIVKSSCDLTDKVCEYFTRELSKYKDVMEVQIVVAMKTRGNMSCYNLNNKIQEIYNPKRDGENEVLINIGKSKNEQMFYSLRIRDKVINVKNNYKCVDINGIRTPIFNGNMGIIQDIDDNGYCTVEFTGIGTVVLTKNESKNLELAYACTTHKCITEDTWIYTDNGLIQLKELNNMAKEFELKPLSKNIKVFNGKSLEQPSAFYNAGLSECRKIKTTRGYELTGTLDHKVDILGKDGYIETKYTKDLCENDYLLINKNINVYGNNIEIPIKWTEGLDELNIRAIKYNFPNKLTKDLARFLGYMVADGTVCKNRLKYGKNHLNVVEDFNRVVTSVFGYKTTPIRHVCKDGIMGGMYLSEVNSSYIGKICKNIDGIQPHDKYVPKLILESPREFQIEFLKGVFEDGTVCIKHGKFDHISFTANEEKLINQVRFMLQNIGIISTKYFRKNNYTLFIYGNDCDIFIKNIGFVSDVKNEKSLKFYDKKVSTSKVIPYISVICKYIIAEYNLKISNIDNNLFTALKYDRVTYTMLNRILDICDENDYTNYEIEYLRELSNNYIIDDIKTLTNTTKNTYCIEMPETHQFLQNGIRSWNCQGSGFKSTIVAMDNSSYVMNNSELLYTSITRAKKYCTLIGVNSAITGAIKRKEVKTKQTFLKDMLCGNIDLNISIKEEDSDIQEVEE